MANNILKLKLKRIVHRRCPTCGSIALQEELDKLKRDMYCYYCNTSKLSEFVPHG